MLVCWSTLWTIDVFFSRSCLPVHDCLTDRHIWGALSYHYLAGHLGSRRHKAPVWCLSVSSFFYVSLLWHCWLGDRKGIQPVKKLSDGVLAWSSFRSKVKTCIWPSWCHCHSLSHASLKSRLVSFLVPALLDSRGQEPLNGCVCISVVMII